MGCDKCDYLGWVYHAPHGAFPCSHCNQDAVQRMREAEKRPPAFLDIEQSWQT